MSADDALKEFTKKCRNRVDSALERWLPATHKRPKNLHEAMRYSVFNGGKRMRPILSYGTGVALGLNLNQLDAVACAVEFIHAYSLVHDDLPAMDNDDLRRGKPTCHIKFDEATAILVGDGLQTLAFFALATDPTMSVTAENRIKMADFRGDLNSYLCVPYTKSGANINIVVKMTNEILVISYLVMQPYAR